jgi:hypothetical protein
MYHTDALVFSDDLLRWCEAGWACIGAPWIPSEDVDWLEEPAVGNGGFALMKVDSCLRLLSTRHREEPLRTSRTCLRQRGASQSVVSTVCNAEAHISRSQGID